MKKNLVVLSGAGVSAESGLSTFRDAGGLWEGFDVMEVASVNGWRKNKNLVLDFYNQRRSQLKNVKPNNAHLLIAELEKYFNVCVVTQNVDDLHERAGSSDIIHLHGKLTEAKSSLNQNLIYDIGYKDINIGDLAADGSQLRPNIVWFGEQVPKITEAAEVISEADIVIVIGTSLVVYPAAGLIEYASPVAQKYIIDPVKPTLNQNMSNLEYIEHKASKGMEHLFTRLLYDFT
ncbi:MAG TPA: Sir2 family NAD-dependent protein deacetylase [Ignavibacteria bacterium]|nr:Sir2 family NAD-dependent protein deacetylase [Ignavibacteria bacterium]